MANTMLTGRYEIIGLSASGVELGGGGIIASFHSSECSGVVGTPIALPVNQPKMRPNTRFTLVQDQYIMLRVTPGATVTEATSTTGVTTVKIPIRVRDMASGVTRRDTIAASGTGATPTGSPSNFTFTILRPQLTGQVWTAGIAYPMYQWKIPAGVMIQFGQMPLTAGDYTASSISIQHDFQTS